MECLTNYKIFAALLIYYDLHYVTAAFFIRSIRAHQAY